MSRAMMLIVLLALGYVPRAHAADDAPVNTDLKCYTAQERANLAKELVRQDARIKSLEESQGVPTHVVVLIAVGAALVGGAAGYGVFRATTPAGK